MSLPGVCWSGSWSSKYDDVCRSNSRGRRAIPCAGTIAAIVALNPNPPKGSGPGVDTRIDGYGKANGPGQIPIGGIEGSGRWPRQWKGGGLITRYIDGGGRRKRPGGMPEVALAGWAGASVRDSPGVVRWERRAPTARRQAGRGMARNGAKAQLNWASQGQRWGRCRVGGAPSG